MKIYKSKFAIAFTIYLLELCITHNKTIASTLFIGPNGSFVKDINSVNIYQNKLSNNISDKQEKSNDDKSHNIDKDTVQNNSKDILESAKDLQEKFGTDELALEEQLANSQNFNQQSLDSESLNANSSEDINNLIENIDPEKINEDIKDRYYGLVEDEETSLLESNQLTKEILENETTDSSSQNILKENNEITKKLIAPDRETNSNINSSTETEKTLKEELIENSSKGVLLGILLGGGVITLLTFNSLKSQGDWGILGFIFNRSSKSQIPDKAIELYRKNLKKTSNFATKIERMDDAKFKNREFIRYLQLENEIQQGKKKDDSISLSIEYLKVGILAQSSFLKLESTELRYRSHKQQDFYKFVAENITDNINKTVFRNRVAEKLAEIKPLINSEEGKNALQSYFNEINKISKYDLGLKLLSLFKKYQLADFTILRRVSDLVEQASAENLSTDGNLKLVVLENYDTFKKLAPIIELEESKVEPQFFIQVLQYLGLSRRYEKAFQEFQNLLKVLRQWEKAYDSLKIIRQQYSSNEYNLPKEFNREIPGLKTYEKYQKYLEKNK